MDLSTATPEQIEKFYAAKPEDYYKKFTSNQLRNFFSEIVSIRTKYRALLSKVSYSQLEDKDLKGKLEMRLRKLKPMLLYAESKQTGRTNLENFRKDTFVLIDSILDNKGDFNSKLEKFFEIMEGIVAYHKYYE